jgi:Spy/CpxP family protein refolding chaperone
MMPSRCRRALVVCLLLVLNAAVLGASVQSQSSPWWKSEQVTKELGLTADQSARIDKIFQSTLPELRQEMDELGRLEAKLSRLIDGDAEESQLTRQIDRVETSRANLSKTRTLMLLQMRRVLTPDQRTRLTALQERRNAEGRHDQRSPGEGQRPR